MNSRDQLIFTAFIHANPDYRQSVGRVLEQAPGLKLTATWPDGRTAIRKITQRRPDILLMDTHLPDMDIITCIHTLKYTCPKTRILMFSACEEADTIQNTLMAGASGYILTGDGPETLLRAITELHSGGVPLSRNIVITLISLLNDPVVDPFKNSKANAQPRSVAFTLTSREEEVLQLLSSGKMYKEVASELCLALGTVKKHAVNVYRKLCAGNRIQAINNWKPGLSEQWDKLPAYMPVKDLTKKEAEVIHLLNQGKMYREIASLLCVSIETAKKHIRNIYQKLQVQNRMQAINKWRTAPENGG